MDILNLFKQPEGYIHFKNIYSLGYLDPGTGYVFTSSVPAIIGMMLAFLASIIVFFKLRILPIFKKYPFIIGLGIVIFLAVIMMGVVYYKNSMNKKIINKRVIVLGLDGMESSILEKGWEKGLYPNLRKLRDNGSYSQLQTVVPPQSPIVWASFITGTMPAKHGIFDFIARNPQTYALDLTFANPDKNSLRYPPFWEELTKLDIPVSVLFLPDTFPPIGKATILSGMGVPDITGTMGAFTLITSSDKYALHPKWRGRLVKIAKDSEVNAVIEGPRYTQFQERKTSTVPITIKKDLTNKTLNITVQNQTIIGKENEFTDWVYLHFNIDFFTSKQGMVQFYVKSIDPDIVLYATPINIVPQKPVFQISQPKQYAVELQKRYGQFYTQGLPHDTWALEENIFDDATFLRQADQIFSERKRIIEGELGRNTTGLFIGYFGILDTIQHMYWSAQNDPLNPYQKTIETYYSKIDDMVGDVLKQLNNEDMLLLVSDHGFASFDYEFNMNSWLRDNRYLFLKNDETIGNEYLENIDWNKTKAYAVGYNGIYFNLRGREKNGVVSQEEQSVLEEEITDKLLGTKNPITQENIVKHIYTRNQLGISEKEDQSPDLFVGYYKGIRSSWDTVIGASPNTIVQKRESKWSGDHLFDPTEVPGIFFINKKLSTSNRSIVDIAPTIFDYFSLKKPEFFDGISIK